jgi:hypothetical protein
VEGSQGGDGESRRGRGGGAEAGAGLIVRRGDTIERVLLFYLSSRAQRGICFLRSRHPQQIPRCARDDMCEEMHPHGMRKRA